MALDFPANPTDGQVYGSYIYSATSGVWKAREESAAPAVVSPTPPTSANNGDIWIDTSDGIAYFYYSDGSTSQWVEIMSSGVPQLTSKANLSGATFTGDITATNFTTNINKDTVVIRDTNSRTQLAGLSVSSSLTDNINDSPWYGIGKSNLVLTDATTGQNSIQVGGYFGLNLKTAENELKVGYRNNASGLLFNGNAVLHTGLANPTSLPNQTSFRASSSTFTAGSGVYTGYSTGNSGDVFRYRNIGNNFNTSTGTFTAPIAGRYFVSATYHQTNATVQRNIGWLYINGSNIGEWTESYGQFDDQPAHGVFYLNANDYVQVATHPSISYPSVTVSVDLLT